MGNQPPPVQINKNYNATALIDAPEKKLPMEKTGL